MSIFYAQLEFDPVLRQTTQLVLYRTKKNAQDGDDPLMHIDLTNEDLSELVVMQKLKIVNTNT